MSKRPCIRGLKEFRKGCPEKCWDGNEGCPCWTEIPVSNINGNEPTNIIKNCCTILNETFFPLEILRLLEGNQMATESFRNGMCEDINGKIYPKPDQVMVKILNTMQKQKEENLLLERNGLYIEKD